MSKQQTAVDYLVEQFAKYYSIHQLDEEIEQAKAMEKEHIIKAILSLDQSIHFEDAIDNAEQYYYETYESKVSDDHIGDDNEMVKISDEEIIKLANEYILYNDSKRQWVIEGMKLYREQFKKK
jgi:hypothetical protein